MSFDANGKLQEAWAGVVTPYSQIKSGFLPEKGQYDLVFTKLEPTVEANGMYAILTEVTVQAPQEMTHLKNLRRSLYIGTKADNFAENPETRKKSPSLAFLRNVAKACGQSTNDQTDAQLCAAILGKPFGLRLETRSYTKKDGVTQGEGWEFGKNPTPVGLIPARLDADAATPTTVTAAPNGHATGATFATE